MYEDREYKIGEFAAMTGMTPSRVRFYEKEGLFPVRKKDNGYRYFTANDAFRANAFQVLLVYGFSVDEAIRMLDERQDTPSFEYSLVSQRAALDRKISELRYRQRRIDSTLDLLQNPEPTSSFSIQDVEDQLFVRASEGDDFSASTTNEREIAAFYDLLGLTNCARIIAKADFDAPGRMVNPSYIIALPETEARQLGRFDLDRTKIERLVMGKCLRFHRKLTRSQSLLKQTFEPMFSYLTDHGYCLRGDILLVPTFLNLDGEGSDIETLLAPIE